MTESQGGQITGQIEQEHAEHIPFHLNLGLSHITTRFTRTFPNSHTIRPKPIIHQSTKGEITIYNNH